MANKIPVKAVYTGSDVTALGEYTSTDKIDSAYLNTGTTANDLVQLDGSAKLPAVDGSLLTGIDTLPSQTGNAGKYLTTDATNASWSTVTAGAAYTSSATAPTSPSNGDHWFDSTNGVLYVRVDANWVDVSTAGATSGGGGGGGDMVKIATQAFDGSVTSLTFTDCFSDTYDYYQVVLSQLENDSGGWAEFYGLLSSDSGSTWHSDYGYINTSQTKLRFGGVDFGASPLYQFHGNFMITGARDTSAFTTNIGQIMKMTTDGVSAYPVDIRNTLKSKLAVDTIKFYPSSGTMDRGTITIYGLKG
jgi:hypothetical protein